MNLLHRTRAAVTFVKEDGIVGLLSILFRLGLPNPLSAESKWRFGIRSEVRFWDRYFRTKGSDWPETYPLRFDPGLPLQARPAALLPSQSEVDVLDVGAGPLTYLGKTQPGRRIRITAVDPLADEYDRLLSQHGIRPLVRTQKLAAEQLTERFPPESFDLVFARNSIDHSFDPELAIGQMISVVKKGGYVLLEHQPNEAEGEHYTGLHQWNFSMSASGDFMIASRLRSVNMTRKYAAQCRITCEMVRDEEAEVLVVTRILRT
jgi:SAM-dependent methyltransferase